MMYELAFGLARTLFIRPWPLVSLLSFFVDIKKRLELRSC